MMTKDPDELVCDPDDELGQQLLALTRELRTLVKELHTFSPIRSLYHRPQFWAALLATMTFFLGSALLIGGPRRISVNAWWVVNTYGGHVVWGSAFVAGSLFTALCAWKFRRILNVALLMQGLLYSFIAVSFLLGAARYLDANLTAGPVYAWIVVLHVLLADFARREFKN